MQTSKKVFIFVILLILGLFIMLQNTTKISADAASDVLIMKNLNHELEKQKLRANSAETYAPSDRKWQGIPQIAVTNGGRVWVSWYSGGKQEPDTDNYIILAYSDDGKNFVDPFIIIDHADTSKRVFDPVLSVNRETNELLIYMCVNGYGKCLVTIPNPDANPEDITWNEAVNTTFGNFIHPELKLDNGDWLIPVQQSTSLVQIMASSNQGKTWAQKTTVTINPDNKTSHECQMVQFSDGTIWLLARIDSGVRGGIEKWVSYDNGKSFFNHEDSMDAPLCGPGSKFSILRLPSGMVILANNEGTGARSKINIYYTLDNGATWKLGLRIETRNDATYPELTLDKDNNIHIVWDKGRYQEHEIRYSKFTEQDILNGYISSENSRDRVIVSKVNSEYYDIIKVAEQFDKVKKYQVGSITKKEIAESLPTSLNVFFEDGNSLRITGKWKADGFDPDIEGVYYFYFVNDSILPLKYSDTYDLLSCYVVLENSKDKKEDNLMGGCASVISSGIVTIISLIGMAIVLLRAKNEKQD